MEPRRKCQQQHEMRANLRAVRKTVLSGLGVAFWGVEDGFRGARSFLEMLDQCYTNFFVLRHP